MRDPFQFSSQRPWTVLVLLALVTVLAVSRIVDFSTGEALLRIDPSTNRLLPESDPGKQFYEYVRKLFGSDETMLVALHEPGGVFTTETLKRMRRITERIEAMAQVHHVLSLTNARNIRGTEEGIDVQPFVGEIPSDPVALDQIRLDALSNPIYAGNLVSPDGTTAALIIYFRDFSDAEFIDQGIDAEIERIAREEAGDAEVWLTGGPHIKVAQFNFQNGDLQRSAPLILIASMIVLAISFRRVRAVVLCLATVIVALIWTLGMAGWLGKPLNAVTTLIVPLFLILPLSYCVHVVAEYYESARESSGLTGREVMQQALGRVWLPVALTGLTTGAGFVALVLSPIGAIREFGVLAVSGIFFTVVAALTLPPAVLAVLPLSRAARSAHPQEREDAFTRFAGKVATFNFNHRREIFVAAALVVVVSVAAATQLQVGAQGVKTFPPQSSVRQDFDAVNASLEGANLFNVVVQAAEPGAFEEPENLRTLERLQSWLEEQPEVGGTTSVVEYLKLCHRAFFENDPARFAIPDSKRLATQILFFCSGDELEGFIDVPRQRVNVIVRANVIDTELVSDLTNRIEKQLSGLPEHLSAEVTGNPILINRLFDDIVRGQARSVIAAFVFIYAILVVMFLSWKTAAIALIPNLLPVAFYFGALGVTGVTLNFATSLIAPMALGIAIDDTIHYFSRFTQDAKTMADERKATIRALRTVGRPVTFTTIVLVVDFLVLTGSDLRTFVQFGALGAATLAFAWVVDFTLTPALCSGLRIVTIWDTLTLDLGEDPQSSIPIFRGLSNTNCRILAQMANLREVPAGTALFRAGDPGQEMFVIIDGKVDVWIETAEGRRQLNTLSRGDVLGEVALFSEGSVRSANVDVVDDVRLLRLTPNNLERLRRRHSRIASTLHENLNRVLAAMVVKDTERLRAG